MVNTLGKQFAVSIAGELFANNRKAGDPNAATTGLNQIVGHRFTVALESLCGAELDETLFKRLTGEDEFRQRRLFQEVGGLVLRFESSSRAHPL